MYFKSYFYILKDDESHISAMTFFKVTSKTRFVDDDIIPCKRYFYRVRAENAAGKGPWSEAASRVQEVSGTEQDKKKCF